jgi:murein DD-endopeptidase MepM/ murein hydrolase activator NlpD
MTDCAELFVKRNIFRFALTGLVGIWLSGCSADATRFGEGNPFTNPFSTASNDAAAPTPKVGSTPLASANPKYVAAAHPNPVAVSALPTSSPVSTGQIRSSAVQPVKGSAVGWTAVGGSPVIVAENDSLDGLSQRYGVPAAALLSANGLSSPSQVRGGMRIVVPVYNAGAKTGAEPVATSRQHRTEVAEAAPPRSKKAAKKADREVADADTAKHKAKKKVEREAAEASDDAVKSKAKKRVERETADASDDAAKSKHKMKVERETADASDDVAKSKHKKKVEREAIEASDDADKSKHKKKVEHETAEATRSAKIDKAKSTAPVAAPAETTVAKVEPSKTVPKKGAVDPTPTGNVRGAGIPPVTGQQADAAGTAPEFRWPARGRIIQGFKSGGNDGINISVPEGTSVRAAENGTVAYAGSELKGYGNLVLIRHPNGFVTAYANNGELNVKRGEVVKRGQVIAKSGQSGNVSSPQLHFELRKGSTPVDPTSYLAGL